MAVPKYEELMLPTLEYLAKADGTCTGKEIEEHLAERLELNEEDLVETTPGGSNRFKTNASWARTYMKKAGLIESPARNRFVITEEGRAFAVSHPEGIRSKDLEAFPGFVEFQEERKSSIPTSRVAEPEDKVPIDGVQTTHPATVEPASEDTPEDVIEAQFGLIQSKLADELLETVMEMSDYRFESFVVELLQAMGYGGADPSSGVVTKQTADGGIDGIVHEDKLGFDSIYIQAKHWDPERTVTRPEVQGFAGALAGEGANKGLFITTAHFSEGARDYVRNLSTAKTKIVLVDGQQLAQLMIEYDFGVTVRKTYELKTIDRDFFDEDA